MQYIYNDYLKYIGHGKDFRTEIVDLHKTKLTYFEETVNAFKLLYEQKQGKIYVFYSGGIDSEYAISIFQVLKIPIVPVIIKFQNDLNSHDTDYAFKFCRDRKLDPLVIDFDIIKFVESGRILDISTRFKNYAYQYNATLDTIMKFDGTVFMAEGDPYFRIDTDTNTWNYIEFERNLSLIEFFKEYNVTGTPILLAYTSGMLSSLLLDPVIKKLTNNEFPGRISSFSSRYKIYNNNPYFSLESRQKYGGYEKFEQLDIFKTHPVFDEFKKLIEQYSNLHIRDYKKFLIETGLND